VSCGNDTIMETSTADEFLSPKMDAKGLVLSKTPNPGQKRRGRRPKKSQDDEILPSVKRQKKLPRGELKPFRVTKSGSNTYARLGLNFDLITSFENESEMKTIESKSTISIKALEPKTENTVRNIQKVYNLLWVYNSLIFPPENFQF